MPSPVPLKLILQALRNKGFIFVLRTGSHAKYRKINGRTLNVIVPIHGKEVPYKTFRSILRQADIREKDHKKLKEFLKEN